MEREKKRLFLGIDTSNYTTSLALCEETGRILLNWKKPLPVRPGERGLRQSEAVFLHGKGFVDGAAALREALGAAAETSCPDTKVDGGRDGQPLLQAVGVSVRPRDKEGSYMPCFLAGQAVGETAAALCGVPAFGFSHQAGHVMAALASACGGERERKRWMAAPFCAFHVSGGTTDVLYCAADGSPSVFAIERIGGTKDLNAGQVIDRCGVRMGLPFPCGTALDQAAARYRGKIRRDRLAVDGTWCCLSGLENKAAALFEETGDLEETSAYLFDFLGRTFERLTLAVRERYGDLPLLYAGGVMSSAVIRKRLSPYGAFAEPAYSSDNAAGAALLARERFLALPGRLPDGLPVRLPNEWLTMPDPDTKAKNG